MALANIVILFVLLVWLPTTPTATSDLSRAFANLWRPEVVLGLQGLWVVLFSYAGRSQVTPAILAWHIKHDAI